MTNSAEQILPRCAVVIPTYNGAMLTQSCLRALLAHPPESCSWRIIVVDDASQDDTLVMLAQYEHEVSVVAHTENLGFAHACNGGASAAGDCDYVVFLNNDTIPTAGWLDALVSCAQAKPQVGAVGARLLLPNGSIQHAGVAISEEGWPLHIYAGFPGEHPAVNRSRAVTAVTGACMLMPTGLFGRLGGFDTDFHNGYEDVDLCLRLRQHGHEVWYCHASVLYHLESVTRWPTGEAQGIEGNVRLYQERWRGRVPADDMQRYLEDGLLSIEYGPSYPLQLAISPLLATVRVEGEELVALQRLLSVRSRRVMELQAANTRSALRRGSPTLPLSAPKNGRSSKNARVVTHGDVYRLSDAPGDHLVSLVLPVKNQEQDVRELLPLVLAQKARVELEIVAVDSGSRDGTVQALVDLGATVLAVDPADFDHGLTRNLAAKHARGDVLLFLSGRSRPAGDRWLAPLLAVLQDDPRAAGVCSRVLPRPDADLLTAKDGERELSGSPKRERKAIDDWEAYRRMSVQERRVFLNFHTVGAALRTDAFRQKGFRSVSTLGEDLLWAREMLEGGWSLWHEPASVIHHSHQYTLAQLFARNVDDGCANREINERTLEEGELLPLVRALVADDWDSLERTIGLTDGDLDHWKLESALRRMAQVMGQWVGVNHDRLPEGMASFFSGVQRARKSG